MKSFQAQYRWNESFGSAVSGAAGETRTITYVRPNHFLLVSVSMQTGGAVTTISDGNRVVEYTNDTGLPPQTTPR